MLFPMEEIAVHPEVDIVVVATWARPYLALPWRRIKADKKNRPVQQRAAGDGR
jgi:hypothetical protein